MPEENLKKTEKRDKPDSVFDHHSSRPKVTRGLQHSTREHWPSGPQAFTYVSLHLVEFTWFHYALLSKPYILSVALVLTSRWTGVTRYDALWCPDFPPGVAPQR